MKPLLIGSLSAVIVVGFSGLSMAGAFEGVIHIEETDDESVTQQKWFIKGDKLRFESLAQDEEKTFMVFDAKKKIMYSVQPEGKSYLEMPFESLGEGMGKVMEETIVTRTGKTDKVAGYTCEIYRSKDTSDGSTGEMCVAKGLGNAAMFGLTGSEAGRDSVFPRWMRNIFKDGGFPLRGSERDANGKVESRWVAIKVEKRRLEDSLFVVPVGYAKIDMSSMMKKMQQAQDEQQAPTRGPGKAGHKESGPQEDLDMDALMKQFGDAMKKQGEGK